VGFQQEVELGEVEDDLLAERALEAEVEVVQGLDGRQPGCLDPQLAPEVSRARTSSSSTAVR
jgi:hypothetical protein